MDLYPLAARHVKAIVGKHDLDAGLAVEKMIRLAFTTRLPLAVMIAMDIKLWENRRH